MTAESYRSLEANGFAGTASDVVLDGGALADQLARYRPKMGDVNRELARNHHEAVRHGVEVSELLGEMAPEARPSSSPLFELARALRNQWQADGRAASLGLEAALLRERLDKAEGEVEGLFAEIDRLRETRRFRLAGALGRPLDLVRARVRRD